MVRGKVKWFDQKKGYGFISADDGKDIFVHHSGIEGAGLKTLAEGQPVEFETEQSDKGSRAVQVRSLGEGQSV
jgi:CspA family cold shock protein